MIEFEKKSNGSSGGEKEKPDFSKVSTWEELYDAIDMRGGVEGSKQFFSAEELKALIDEVRKGFSPLSVITREGNLRSKVQELLKHEAN